MTNIAILTGRIARDPDTRETKGGTSVTGITVVTDRPARDKDGKTYKDENGYTAKDSEFHRVTCFNGLPCFPAAGHHQGARRSPWRQPVPLGTARPPHRLSRTRRRHP
nr:single-stranded DNA-binding protein [Erythrobacter sp. 3-20A1M]